MRPKISVDRRYLRHLCCVVRVCILRSLSSKELRERHRFGWLKPVLVIVLSFSLNHMELPTKDEHMNVRLQLLMTLSLPGCVKVHDLKPLTV